jgi:hypothetical protein
MRVASLTLKTAAKEKAASFSAGCDFGDLLDFGDSILAH